MSFGVDELNETREDVWVGLWQDAMTQVEDVPWSDCALCKNSARFGHDSVEACETDRRVEVPLKDKRAASALMCGG